MVSPHCNRPEHLGKRCRFGPDSSQSALWSGLGGSLCLILCAGYPLGSSREILGNSGTPAHRALRGMFREATAAQSLEAHGSGNLMNHWRNLERRFYGAFSPGLNLDIHEGDPPQAPHFPQVPMVLHHTSYAELRLRVIGREGKLYY